MKRLHVVIWNALTDGAVKQIKGIFSTESVIHVGKELW